MGGPSLMDCVYMGFAFLVRSWLSANENNLAKSELKSRIDPFLLSLFLFIQCVFSDGFGLNKTAGIVPPIFVIGQFPSFTRLGETIQANDRIGLCDRSYDD